MDYNWGSRLDFEEYYVERQHKAFPSHETTIQLNIRDDQALLIKKMVWAKDKVQVRKSTEADENDLMEVSRNIWLFCYGSNNPQRSSERLGRTIQGTPAYLPGYNRVFRGFSRTWESGVASLTASRARGAAVYGYATQVSGEELERLDVFEGTAVGAYARKTFQIKLVEEGGREKQVTAHAYVSKSRVFNAPSQQYLEAVVATISPFWTEGEEGVTVDDIPIRNPYHRSQTYFETFGTAKMRFGDYGPGLYFAEDHMAVKNYGPYLYQVTFNLKNPLNIERDSPEVIDALERHLQLRGAIMEGEGPPLIQLMGMAQSMWENLKDPIYNPNRVIRVLQSLGYDGIVVPSKGFSVLFDPKQITSFSKMF